MWLLYTMYINAMLIFLADHRFEDVTVAPSNAGVPFMLGFIVNLGRFPTYLNHCPLC